MGEGECRVGRGGRFLVEGGIERDHVSPVPAAANHREEESDDAANRHQRAEFEETLHAVPVDDGASVFGIEAVWFVGFDAQGERREDIGSEVDREDLHGGDGCRDTESESEEYREEFAHIRGEDIVSEFPEIGEDGAPLADAAYDIRKVIVEENHIGGFLGNIGADNTHRDADIGFFQGGRVVYAVTGHRDDFAVIFESGCDTKFLFRSDASEDDVLFADFCDQLSIGEAVELFAVYDVDGRILFDNADIFSDRARGDFVVAGNHNDAESKVAAFEDGLSSAGSSRINHRHHTDPDDIPLHFLRAFRFRDIFQNSVAEGDEPERFRREGIIDRLCFLFVFFGERNFTTVIELLRGGGNENIRRTFYVGDGM